MLLIKQCLFYMIAIAGLGNLRLHSQVIDPQAFQQKINQYALAHPKQVLFVQTDKTIYSCNETIWFAGYLLQDVKDNLLRADMISVALVDEASHKIVLQKKYVFNSSICPGSFLLPDTIQPGNYQLLAFTNLVDKQGEPVAVFRQHLTIKADREPAFTTNFTIDTLSTDDTVRIEVKVVLPGVGTGLASFATVDYYLQAGQPKTLKLDVYGRGHILLPLAAIRNAVPVLFTTTRFKKNTQSFNVQLPHLPDEDTIKVLFYPEGGDLVDGLESRVAWEAKTTLGAPVQGTALLLKDGKITDTLKSSHYGIGVLHLVPEKNSHYLLRLLVNEKKLPWKDFPLPVSLRKGVVLDIKNAIAADTLNIHIKSSFNHRVSIAVSNTGDGTISAPIDVNRERIVRLPLGNISKGLNTITIIDENGRPVAERLFFAHFDKRAGAVLQTDPPIIRGKK